MEPHKVSSIPPKPSWLTQEDGCHSGFPAASSRLEPSPLTTPVKQGAKREVSFTTSTLLTLLPLLPVALSMLHELSAPC
jgi:hypothetical protein